MLTVARRRKSLENEATFKRVNVNKSAGSFNPLFPPVCWRCDGGCAGIITNKYWFEYMGLSQLWITVMGPGIIESVQIVIWANEWIVPRDLRGFSRLETVMCGNSFHCLARCGGGGGIVKRAGGAPGWCHSQFYRERYDETCVSARFEITPRLIFTPEYSLVQLLKAAECLSAFMCTGEEILRMKSYSQLSVHKSASHYENQHMAT